MGLRELTIIECDCCDLKVELEGGDGSYAGINRVDLKISSAMGSPVALWGGYLCDPCEGKMRDQIKSALPAKRDSPAVKDSAC